MLKRIFLLLTTVVATSATSSILAQEASTAGLTDMRQSQHAVMANTPLGAVRWTGGFWGERFEVYSKTSVQHMWDIWRNADLSHGFRNFEIAAGECDGHHSGPPFHDGDMYKWMEGVAAVYAITKDPELDKIMDTFIARVVKAQREDGYIHTPVIIDERNKGIDTHRAEPQQAIGTKVGP